MSVLVALQTATSLNDVARLLKYKPKTLAYYVRVMAPSAQYSEFKIPKRSGGHRVISAPRKELKHLQRRLSDLLQDCLAEIEVKRGVTVRLAHGFKRGGSITTNASVHRRRRYVFNLDLSDFFGTINFGRVRGFFIKSRDFSLSPDVATLIAQIACHNNALPQGSPCSPIISNLVGNILDIHLSVIARATGCTYSRYADDLTFSTSESVFPPEVAVPVAGDPNSWQLGDLLAKAITRAGFRVNPQKTRMQYRNSRQSVTGIVVNKRLNTPIEYRRKARAMVNRLLVTGAFDIPKVTLDSTGETVVSSQPGTIKQLEGLLTHILYVDKAASRELSKGKRQKDEKGNPVLSSNERLLRDLIFYKDFAASESPTIITEGKTDQIYLACAIKALFASYPHLVDSKNPSSKLAVKFFGFTERNRDFFHFAGGTGDFADFIKNYRRMYQRVQAPKGASPVIILIDNDAGSKPVKSLVQNYLKIPLSGKLSAHLFENVYLVMTPIGVGAAESCIEDCFSSKTLGKKIDGKSFNPADSIDTATEYGKQVFAEKVVKAGAASIDFTGFASLLDEVAKIVRDHSSKRAASHSATGGLSSAAGLTPAP